MKQVAPVVEQIPATRPLFRLADPAWVDPTATTYALVNGGRWNSPGSHQTLYLCADEATAAAQVRRLLRGSFLTPEDLRDDAFVLITVTLPTVALVADAHSTAGLMALGLPTTYPRESDGTPIPRARCQPIGDQLAQDGLEGVHARSATDGAAEHHRELAWFPRDGQSAQIVKRLPFGQWRHSR